MRFVRVHVAVFRAIFIARVSVLLYIRLKIRFNFLPDGSEACLSLVLFQWNKSAERSLFLIVLNQSRNWHESICLKCFYNWRDTGIFHTIEKDTHGAAGPCRDRVLFILLNSSKTMLHSERKTRGKWRKRTNYKCLDNLIYNFIEKCTNNLNLSNFNYYFHFLLNIAYAKSMILLIL